MQLFQHKFWSTLHSKLQLNTVAVIHSINSNITTTDCSKALYSWLPWWVSTRKTLKLLSLWVLFNTFITGPSTHSVRGPVLFCSLASVVICNTVTIFMHHFMSHSHKFTEIRIYVPLPLSNHAYVLHRYPELHPPVLSPCQCRGPAVVCRIQHTAVDVSLITTHQRQHHGMHAAVTSEELWQHLTNADYARLGHESWAARRTDQTQLHTQPVTQWQNIYLPCTQLHLDPCLSTTKTQLNCHHSSWKEFVTTLATSGNAELEEASINE